MDLKANNAIVSMEISITRKATGNVEKYILTGHMEPEAPVRVPVVHESSGNLVSQSSGVSI